MSKYNEQHAATMLNALIGTNTLKQYKKEVIEDFVKGYIADEESCKGCSRNDDYCCIKCYIEGYIKRNCTFE